jgi:hypothetical protein
VNSAARTTRLVAFGAMLAMGAAQVAVAASALRKPEPAAWAFSEDAFYAFSVARNVAEGRGITSDGTQPTSGFQPLWTLFVTGAHALFHHTVPRFACVYLMSFFAWALAAWLFVRFGSRFVALEHGWAWFAAAWFLADGNLQSAFANGLETGLTLTLLLVLLIRWCDAPLKRSWWVDGLLAGFLFLARVDSCFLTVPYLVWPVIRAPKAAVAGRALLAGALALAVASPWLAYNHSLTGTFMPQSGLATNTGVNFVPVDDAKLWLTVQTLFALPVSSLVPIARLPGAVVVACGAVLLALFALALRGSPHRQVAGVAALAGLAMAIWYFWFSGARWHFTRYFLPLKILCLLGWLIALDRWTSSRPGLRRVLPSIVLVLITAMSLRRARFWLSHDPDHAENMLAMTQWVNENPHARVGMFESGRAGYRLPDNVVNLDGKLNLPALRASRDGRFLAYLASAQLDALYFADYDLPWLDGSVAGWRGAFVPAGKLSERSTMTLYLRRATAR